MEQGPRLASTRARAMAGEGVEQTELTSLGITGGMVIQVWMLVAFQV